MTKREKILIGVTVVATSASVCMFAFVSLAQFLKTPQNIAPPLVSKLYDNTITQLTLLEPVPVTAVTTSQVSNVVAAAQSSEPQLQSSAATDTSRRNSKHVREHIPEDPAYTSINQRLEAAGVDPEVALNQLLQDVDINDLKRSLRTIKPLL